MRNVIYTSKASGSMAEPAGSYFQCDRCRQIKPITPGMTTGYGSDWNTGLLYCVACCGQRDRLAMIETGKATLYLTDKGITNWPGTLAFPVRSRHTFRHPFARHAVVAYFTGPDGRQWSGKNIGDSQIAHCRRLAA